MLKLTMAAALLAAQPTTVAQPCLTRQQVSAMFVTLVPDIVEQARAGCRRHLPETAFLLQPDAEEFADRARSERRGLTAHAVAAFRAFARGRAPAGLRDETIINMMTESLAGMVAASANPSKCQDINALVEGFAPLSPTRTGDAFAAIFALAGVGSDGRSPRICER